MNKDNQLKTGLWTKTSKNGTSYASGKIKLENKEYRVVLFKIKEKKNEKSPDFNIILEEIKEKKDNTEIYAEFGEITEIDETDLAF